MRILLSCLQDLRLHPIPAYRFWAPISGRGSKEAGSSFVEVPDVDWAEGCAVRGEALDSWRERTWTKTLAFAKRELAQGQPIDLFLSYLYPQQIETGAIAELQKIGIPCINFFCDNVREFSSVPAKFRCFTLNWVPEFEALSMYDSARVPCLHAPMPCGCRSGCERCRSSKLSRQPHWLGGRSATGINWKRA